jgi:iron complex transport system permease protein
MNIGTTALAAKCGRETDRSAGTGASDTRDVSTSRASGSRGAVVLASLSAAAFIAFLCSLALGSTSIPLSRVIEILLGSSQLRDAAVVVVQTIRLPRAITALLAGAALGIAGLQMQTLFRNPLADPFALGISSGASLGVALVVLGSGIGPAAAFGAAAGLRGDALMTVAAIVGAMVVLGLVVIVSARISSPTTVLIMGLMFGYTVNAIVMVLVGAAQPERLQQWALWGFGSFSGVTWDRLPIFATALGSGLVLAGAMTKPLNALLLGEHYARSMGVAVRRARLLTMMGASVLGAVVTAFCGPIAFVGIAVPHLCRGLAGTSDHRVLVPAVVLMGAIVALTAQIVSLLPGSAGVLPLNAVTSLIGAPVVIAVLLRSRRGAIAG